jgi:hypothetical protein
MRMLLAVPLAALSLNANAVDWSTLKSLLYNYSTTSTTSGGTTTTPTTTTGGTTTTTTGGTTTTTTGGTTTPTTTTGGTTTTTPTGTATSWWKPAAGLRWQIQYTGTLNTSYNVDVYNIDLYDRTAADINMLHAQGKKVVCYFSGGSYENWRPDASKFPAAVLGKNLDGWPGERWLDVRNLNALGPIMTARLDLAKSKGCDGVDPDNMDGYIQDSGFAISASHQIAYNKFIAAEAHKRGLAVGLKNDVDQVVALQPYFDFAVNEECYKYNECSTLKPFIAANKPVFHIEYDKATTTFCPSVNALGFSSIRKNLNLDSYVQFCR